MKYIELEKVRKGDLNTLRDYMNIAKHAAILKRAAIIPWKSILDVLEKANVEPDEIRYEGSTFLMIAAFSKKPDIVNELLKLYAKPNAKDSAGNTPLIFATKFSHANVTNANVTKRAQKFVESSVRAQEIVQLLLNHGAKPNIPSKNGTTPLMEAAFSKQPAIVNKLLELYANPNAQDSAGNTPLILATVMHPNLSHVNVSKQAQTIVRLLLNHGADPNIPTKNGMTPLMAAAHANALPIVKLLLENNALVANVDKSYRTAIDYAGKGYASKELIELLERFLIIQQSTQSRVSTRASKTKNRNNFQNTAHSKRPRRAYSV